VLALDLRPTAMATFDLVELNVSRLAAPLDSAELTDFVANLDRINELAEGSPGFVWRLKTDEGNATALRPFGPDTLVNLTAWRDLESLRAYVYRSAHGEIMKRRREWFLAPDQVSTVLWWASSGERPTLNEAKARLKLLRAAGPSRAGFTFAHPFPPPPSAGRSEESFAMTLPEALSLGPPPAGNLAVPVFSHGSLEIELYRPSRTDLQSPHTRDEVYVVARGSALLQSGGERRELGEGSIAFVPAGREHRFERVSEEFAVWVLFYGPPGGA
jgi:mannose-6-phosphate isomerase-like protein (cupin superfamily)